MAAAALFVHRLPKAIYADSTDPMLSHVNIGTGKDISIRELAEAIAKIANFYGKITFDTNKPDGTMRKLMDVSKLSKLGWEAKIGLIEGLNQTYAWYQKIGSHK